MPVGEEGNANLSDFIEDKKAVSPLEMVTQYDVRQQVASILGALTPKEEKIMRKRFGIDEKTAQTLEEIGRSFDVTREGIRQLETMALRKLRHPSLSKQLRFLVESE